MRLLTPLFGSDELEHIINAQAEVHKAGNLVQLRAMTKGMNVDADNLADEAAIFLNTSSGRSTPPSTPQASDRDPNTGYL
jgi:hypothetical protein